MARDVSMLGFRGGGGEGLIRPDSPLDMMALLEELYPLRRDIVSSGHAQALRRLAQVLPMQIEGYASGSEAWTWIIPPRWEVDRAYVKVGGRTLIDLADHPLHVMSYSEPIKRTVDHDELMAHLHTRQDQPQAVPFEFSYYKRNWGFCVQHERLPEFTADQYQVLIDSRYEDGELEMGVLPIPGEIPREIVLMAHLCHPAMANDDLAGVVVLMAVAQELMSRPKRRWSYRILVGPETIGPIAYLSRHEDLIPNMELGLFLEMLGNDDRLSLQNSLQGDSAMDLALELALKAENQPFRQGAFREVIANDERVLNGPGVNVPCASLSRSAFWGHGETPYPQYHTSADNPEIISPQRLAQARDVVLRALDMLEANYTPQRRFKGPVFLSRYDLWVDWRVDRQLNAKQEEVMRLIEGKLDLLSIAHLLDLDFFQLENWLNRFAQHDLIEVRPPGQTCC